MIFLHVLIQWLLLFFLHVIIRDLCLSSTFLSRLSPLWSLLCPQRFSHGYLHRDLCSILSNSFTGFSTVISALPSRFLHDDFSQVELNLCYLFIHGLNLLSAISLFTGPSCYAYLCDLVSLMVSAIFVLRSSVYDCLQTHLLSIIYPTWFLTGLPLRFVDFLSSIESPSLRRMGPPGPGPRWRLNPVLSDHSVEW